MYLDSCHLELRRFVCVTFREDLIMQLRGSVKYYTILKTLIGKRTNGRITRVSWN